MSVMLSGPSEGKKKSSMQSRANYVLHVYYWCCTVGGVVLVVYYWWCTTLCKEVGGWKQRKTGCWLVYAESKLASQVMLCWLDADDADDAEDAEDADDADDAADADLPRHKLLLLQLGRPVRSKHCVC